MGLQCFRVEVKKVWIMVSATELESEGQRVSSCF